MLYKRIGESLSVKHCSYNKHLSIVQYPCGSDPPLKPQNGNIQTLPQGYPNLHKPISYFARTYYSGGKIRRL